MPGKPRLSIVIPFCNEYPQILFTIRSIAEEFIGRVPFEILAVNNYSPSLEDVGFKEDAGASACKKAMEGNPWLRVLDYPDHLSHWQAKNFAVSQARSHILLFVDAHVVPSRDALWSQFQYFETHHEGLNGSLHVPVTYQILEWRKLIYKLKVDLELGLIGYTFADFRPDVRPYQVPVMSSCGMMIDRATYDLLGGWPVELGSYSGGEQFWNFGQATLGKNVWIWPKGTLYHHGATRNFPLYGSDVIRNQCIATFIVAGQEMAKKFMRNVRIPAFPKPIAPSMAQSVSILEDVLESCFDHRQLMVSRQTISLEDWLAQWNS